MLGLHVLFYIQLNLALCRIAPWDDGRTGRDVFKRKVRLSAIRDRQSLELCKRRSWKMSLEL